jgi:hypothetical protein
LFSVTQDKTANAYENVRKQVMEENVSRMSEVLKQKSIENGKPMQDFTAMARELVFGATARKPVAVTKGKEAQPKEKDITEDPNYEPDPADEHTADDVFVPDEEEHDVVKSSSKVKKCSILLPSYVGYVQIALIFMA